MISLAQMPMFAIEAANPLINRMMRIAATAIALLLPFAVAAEPITLKLAFLWSDRSLVYSAAVEPFVTAINKEGKGLLEIEVYFSGALGKKENEQPQLVLDGTADIAFIVP